ncbi:McrB family protein [Microcoleus vaginatus]|uniref:McrB family protein n=1 Tax=Microcoleus vaginatus TaxID=119532 RepID=UPI001F604E11|nr:AAA family ATPase [Microcoleus vaginatus HSN003]
MEKVFVHPECPFSENTFNLLTEFYKNRSSDFYRQHKKDLLKYVEEPVKDILSQVEYLLPDFIKEYINLKCEKLGQIIAINDLQSIAYSVALGLKDFYSLDNNPQLRISFEEHKLTFGFHSHIKNLGEIIENYYSNYRPNTRIKELLKIYKFSQPTYYYLTHGTEPGIHDFGLFNTPNKKVKSINELLQYLFNLQQLDVPFIHNINSIQVSVSLESEEILGYSAKQLIHKITQTFKKVFPVFLLVLGDYHPPLSEYLSVYEKEFNPVYQLEEISEITAFKITQLTQWIHAINRKGQTIIQGPPGTGKTFIAEKLAKHLIGGGDGLSDIIQFHPAYTYEDFIEGLRPITQNGQLTYSIVPGRFLEFCEKAEACEDTCVLIIDEINRANLSQVFGELMYLLDDRQDTARFIKLASGKLFRIPTNVRIIGTMNTADRSIALVDNALRRRFAFIPVYPNYEVLQHYHQKWQTGFPVDKLTSILEDVNQAINNQHYELGISFFLTKTLAEDIQDIWQMEIEPYLEEYFFDSLEKMDEFLWENIKNKLGY